MKEFPIICENDEIYIINKPAGVSVQGGAGVKHPLDETLSLQVGGKVFPVHRLDKETAGLLVVAKNHDAASKWTKLFSAAGRAKQIKKEYLALCLGKFPQSSGKITDTIYEHGQEKTAATNYFVEATKSLCLNQHASDDAVGRSEGGTLFWEISVSRVRLVLETGRMHQIRIHLSKIGCPIVGDDRHGNFRLNKMLRRTCAVKNMMLAAVSLTLPIGGKLETFRIEPPEYFNAFDVI